MFDEYINFGILQKPKEKATFSFSNTFSRHVLKILTKEKKNNLSNYVHLIIRQTIEIEAWKTGREKKFYSLSRYGRSS